MNVASAAFPQLETWYAHRVSYGETDAMGVVYYGEYLHIFERSRHQFIRERGMSYNEVEARGIMLPVREVGCRYRVSSHFDDLLWIRAGVQHCRRASLVFVYEVRDEPRTRLLATGFTEHALVDLTGKPVRMPDWFKALFSS